MGYEPAAVDIVMGIFGLENLRKNESWPILDIYEVFYKMKKEEVGKFGDLSFSKRGDHHYSKALEEIFFQLGTSRLLEVRNPQYSCVFITTESKKRIKEFLKKNLSGKDFKEVQVLSKKFREQITNVLEKKGKNLNVCLR